MSDNANNSSAQNGAAATEATAAQAAPNELQLAQAQAEKFKNEYLYLRADFDNYKKNAIKERSEYLKYGSERLLTELLEVFDNFERALEIKVTAENYMTFVKGIELTAQEFRALFKKHGVNEVAAHGQAFDPNVHEALGSEESTTVPPGHVVRVFKKPYKLHEKMIRPGQVVVAKQPTN